MKTSHINIIVLVISIFMLTACGGDSSSDGNSYTGSKSDINAAKKLVNVYSENKIFFEKGWIDYQEVFKNTNQAEIYAQYAKGYQKAPEAYYAMRHVGCITPDGQELLTEQDQHTQMDVIVGERSTRAVYIQENTPNRCYLGSLGWGAQVNVFGIPITNKGGQKGFFGLPEDECQAYEIDRALVRIEKDNYNDRNKQRYDSRKKNDPYYYNASYRGDYNYWGPKTDSYFDVRGNQYGTYGRYNTSGDANQDSFGRLNNAEAVFVSETLRSRSTNPSCDKDVYWGFRINPQSPPQIQILGRNNRSYSDI